ncbi:MAG: oligosaccharide flippase family protein [Bacteroidota bacterium]
MLKKIFQYKTALINSSHVFLNKALNAIVPLFFIPYYNKIFGVEGFGELVYVQSATIVLQFLTDYGFNVTGVRDLSHVGMTSQDQSRKISAIYQVKILLAVISYAALALISIINGFSADKIKLYFLAYTAFFVYSFTPYWFFQGVKNNATITWINLLSKIILLALVLVLVTPGKPLYIVPLLEMISNLVAMALSFMVMIKAHNIRLAKASLDVVREQFHSGKNIFFAAVLNWAITAGTIIILGNYASEAALGYFATFSRLIYYAYAVLQPISLALFPYISEKFSISYQAGMSMVKRIFKFYLVLVMVFVLGAFLLAPIFFSIFFNEVFLQTLPEYMPVFYLLVIWVALELICYFIGYQCLVASGRDNVYSKYYFVNTLITVAGLFLLVPKYLLFGGAISMIAGETVLLILLMRSYFQAVNPPSGNI